MNYESAHQTGERMESPRTLIVVRGAGDLATGTIIKLVKSGYAVIALETETPAAIRRTVSFSEAVYAGKQQVEDVSSVLARTPQEAYEIARRGIPAILVDPEGDSIGLLHPAAVIDAILAKKNLGTHREMAPVTIALGPGFSAGTDVDVVVETKRGHDLGRLIYEGTAAPNTGIPGVIAGYGAERVMHAPASGILHVKAQIADIVEKGAVIAVIEPERTMREAHRENGKSAAPCTEGVPVYASLSGLLRGLIRDGYPVTTGMKIADIDPRANERENCYKISDKARCIAGGVLEALLHAGVRA